MSKPVTINLNVAGKVVDIDVCGVGKVSIAEFKELIKSNKLSSITKTPELCDVFVNKHDRVNISNVILDEYINIKYTGVNVPRNRTVRIDKIVYETYTITGYTEEQNMIKEIYVSSLYDDINNEYLKLGAIKEIHKDIGHPIYKFTNIQIKTMMTNSYDITKELNMLGIKLESWYLTVDLVEIIKNTHAKLIEDNSDRDKLLRWINKAKMLGIYTKDNIEIDLDKMMLRKYNLQSERIVYPPVKVLGIVTDYKTNIITKEIIIPDTVEIITGSIASVNYKKLKKVELSENVYGASIACTASINTNELYINNIGTQLYITGVKRLIAKPNSLADRNCVITAHNIELILD